MKSFLTGLNIQHSHTTAYHPAGNGICEQVNSSIGICLRIFNASPLSTIMRIIERKLSLTTHATLQHAPHTLALKELITDPRKPNKNVLSSALISLRQYQEASARRINSIKNLYNYTTGQQIFVKTARQTKHQPRYNGPYIITKVHFDESRITCANDSESMEGNIRNVRPLKGQHVMA